MGVPQLVAASIASTAYGIDRQESAARDQRRAMRAQQRAAAIQNARERRQAIAQSRVASAQIENRAAAIGIAGSSAPSQVQSSIQSQLSSNLSFQNQLSSLDRQRFSSQYSALRNESRANSGFAISGLSSSFIPIAGKKSTFSGMFGGNNGR